MGLISLGWNGSSTEIVHRRQQIVSPIEKLFEINAVSEGWQEWQGSNLRPPVLETGALPIELHSYVGVAAERAV